MSEEQQPRPRPAMNVQDHYSRSMMRNRKSIGIRLEYCGSFSKDGGRMWRYFTLESLILLLCLTASLLILPLVLPPLPPPPLLLLLLPILILVLLMFLAFMSSDAGRATHTYV